MAAPEAVSSAPTHTLSQGIPLDIPFVKGLPLIGNLFRIRRKEFHLQMRQWCDRHGPILKYRIAKSEVYLIADLDWILEMLKRRPHDFRRTSKIETLFDEIGATGVFSTEGENWRRQRRLIMPAFHQASLKSFFPTLCEITRRLERRWRISAQNGADLEICKDLTRFTVDVTTQVAFDYDMNTLEHGEDVIQKHLEHIFPSLDRRITAIIPYWRYVKLPKDRALENALREIQTEMDKILELSRRALENVPEGVPYKPKNMAESLLMSRDADGSGFTMKEVLGNIFTILVAGEDTTATSLAWALSLMMDHPRVQKRMQEEVRGVLKDASLLEDYDDLIRLEYIEAVILESMRLKPVAPFIFLEACHDLDLRGMRFSKGVTFHAMLSYPALQEKYFSRPDEFLPERWIESERPSSWNHEPKALLPFGGGARVCPGRTLAVLEMKCVLAMLCRNFEVAKPLNGRRLREEFRFATVPVDFWVQLRQ